MHASSPHTDSPPDCPAKATRLAPSPTGALHLGNLRTFLINAALAHQNGWRVILRIEDLDSPRVKPGVIDETIGILGWMGMTWDEGPCVQSDDLSPYADALEQLASRAMAFPCELSRKEIDESISAPHDSPDDAKRRESVYPRELRPALVPRRVENRETNWRFVVGEGDITFTDGFAGERTTSPAESVGDFPIWTKRGVPSYQLCVVVDDARQGVTHVVRGDDLIDSTGRQILLGRALGLPPIESYTHLPLVIGPDGKRLAKRHGDTRVRRYRESGVRAERIVGLIAHWSGVTDEREEMESAEFFERFDLARMDARQTVFTEEDETWLTQRD